MTVSLVLLPGLDGTGNLFRPLLRELPEGVAPVVLSYPAQETLDYPMLTQLVLRSLPADRPFLLLGESFSGPVAVLAAAEQPKGLIGLILCASFVSGPRPWAKLAVWLSGLVPIHVAARAAGQYLLMGRFKTPEVTALMMETLAQVPDSVLRSRLAAAANVDVSAELRSINLPSLYLRANEDRVVPRKAAKAFSRAAYRGNVDVVVGPHFLLQCAPQAASNCIVRFIERLQGGAEQPDAADPDR